MKKWLIISITILCVVALDLLTKNIFYVDGSYNLIPYLIDIEANGGNTGAAFGIFSGKVIMLIIVSVIMIIALFIFDHYYKNKSILYCLSFGFIVGGALGNLYDRAKLGYVRDFIRFAFWQDFPTFNVADSFLCIGAVLLAICILFMSGKKKNE